MKLIETFLRLLTKKVYIPPATLPRVSRHIKNGNFHFSFLKEIFLSLPISEHRKNTYSLLENSGRFFLVDGQNIVTSIIPVRHDISKLPSFLEIHGETLEVRINGVMTKGFTHAFLIGEESVKEKQLIDAIAETCDTEKVELVYFSIGNFDERDIRYAFSTIKDVRKKTGRIIGLEYQDKLDIDSFRNFYMNGVDFVALNESHKGIEDELAEIFGSLGMAHIVRLSKFEEIGNIQEAFPFLEKGITPLIASDNFSWENHATVMKNMKEFSRILEENEKKFRFLPTRNRFLSPYNLCQLFESTSNFESLKRSIERNLIAGKSYASLMEMKRKLRVKETDHSLESSGL